MHKVKIFPEIKKPNWECPPDLAYAHNLCLLISKFSMQIALSGSEHEIFAVEVEASVEEVSDLKNSDDVFCWLAKTGREKERSELTARTAFKAVLEDMMVCIAQSVECAREGKLIPAFILLRKPLEESLIILEEIARNKLAFAKNLEHARNLIEKSGYGGLAGHVKRVEEVLEVAGLKEVFDATYLVELRYDKNSRDTFYGICNKAMHLFTSKTPIATEDMNINLVFSSDDELETQARYFYSRLSYILVYVMELLEYVVGSISSTHVEYVNYQRRRVFSLYLLSCSHVDEHYKESRFDDLCSFASTWLVNDCSANGRNLPQLKDLEWIALWGCYPDESEGEAQARIDFFNNFLANSLKDNQ